ncbi:MAG TPA: phospholipase D-like domain-containing protein, partial [Syntrophobacteraceae bacterium]|nr:phospholipase D-like domain-containing protein [Syntrophobacteraceae bacterium]
MALRGEVGPHFRDRSWAYAYKTSTLREDGSLVDILHEFYIPVLERSKAYDRVAGYFTSSSLAAASQGYSAFTAHGGRMRLIVGADMDPQDVAAVLSGEEARLEKHLDSELEGTWPEDVTRGIELLAWMVSQGFLELRVAFRLHGKTGEPLPFESQEDGYVHEKWALFTDKAGHRILASGSLNESKTSLVQNAENLIIDCDWWEGPSADRIRDHQKDFDALWENRHPHFRVLTLPEAVHRKLVRIGERVRIPREVDGTPRKIPPKPTPEEWLAFKVIQMAPKMPGGLWVGMETAPVSPWPHQEVVARRLIENWPSSFMLCDEVGLGKTIEAGLALRSLILSGVVKRVLVAPPAGLAQQWHREMASKFYLPFRRGVASPVKKHEVLFPDQKWKPADNLF